MTCDDVLPLLSAFHDRELPEGALRDIAHHLDACPRCRRVRAELTKVSMLICAAPQPPLPDGLPERVQDALQARAGTTRALRRRAMSIAVPLLSAAAGAAITALVIGIGPARDRAPDDPFADVVAAHLRSLMDERTTRIASGDPHAVRPWFAGRIDFSPPAPDLSAQGFPLIGARLDYVGERIVAALVYRRRQHVINVFVRPNHASDNAADWRVSTRYGFAIVRWQSAGLSYVGISDLNASELGIFRSSFASETTNSAADEE